MKKTWFVLAAVLTALTVSAGNVQLCGSSYGKHEIKLLVNKAVVREGVIYQHQIVGENIDFKKLPDCKVLIVASSVSKKLTPEEMTALRKWVTDGGHLVLICRAVNGMASVKDWKWAGITNVRVLKKYEVLAVDPASPLLKGIPAKQDQALFGNEVLAVPVSAPMKIIAGNGNNAFIAEGSFGKGKIYLLAAETFRMFNKQRLHPFREHQLTVIRNILDLAAPTSDSNVRTGLLQDWQQKRGGVLVWNREWQRGEVHGPRFNPPMPAEKELIDSIPLHLARNEYESVQINLTPLEKYGLVSWKIDLGGLPANAIKFYVQERPDPIPWKKNPAIAREFPYWLMPPEYVAPKGKPEFKASEPGVTMIVWLRFNTWNVAAGNYNPKLTLKFDNKTSVSVALPLKVAKAAVPRKRPILLGVGGYGIDVNNLDAAGRFLDNLHEHGNEWSTFNVIRLGRVKIKGTDKPLDFKTMKEYASKPDQLPELDFSEFDGWIHANLRRNMTNYRVNLPGAGLNAMFTKAGFPKDKIRASEDWFYRLFSRYLREKGIRMIITSKGDELNRKELYESWLPWAKRLTAAGFDCTSTFSFGASDFTQLVADLSPYTRLWTLNRQLALVFTDAQRKGTIKLRDDAFIGTYGAGEGRGSEFRKPLTASRFLGWESWRNRISTCSPNPWFKGWIYYCDYGNSGQTGGIGGERWLAYLDFKNQKVPMADCPFWEGIREGMEDGNLAFLLEQRARELNRKDVLTKLNQVLADTPSAPLRGKVIRRNTGRYSFDILEISADIHGYRKAKSIVLDLLDSLPPQTALYWHRIDLGQAELQGDAAAIDQFRAEVKKRFDGNAAIKPAKNGTIVKFLVSDKLASPGKFRILEAKKGRTILTVVGGDSAGLKLGVEMFCAYLNQHGKW